MLAKTCSSLNALLLQMGDNAGNVIGKVDGAATVNRNLSDLKNMKLVFDTATRQMLLKKAVKGLEDLSASIAKLPSGGAGNSYPNAAGSSAPASAGSAQPAGTGLYRPMPVIERATNVFNADAMRTGGSSTVGSGSGYDANGEPLGKGIKPSSFLTFSSAESSASARLGVAGKCALCGAHREVASAKCNSCGKSSNIVF